MGISKSRVKLLLLNTTVANYSKQAGSHPIAAPITVVINEPMAFTTILSDDGSAIRLPLVASATYTAGACAFAMGSPSARSPSGAFSAEELQTMGA
jgi:hypothetical protein